MVVIDVLNVVLLPSDLRVPSSQDLRLRKINWLGKMLFQLWEKQTQKSRSFLDIAQVDLKRLLFDRMKHRKPSPGDQPRAARHPYWKAARCSEIECSTYDGGMRVAPTTFWLWTKTGQNTERKIKIDLTSPPYLSINFATKG